MHTKATGQEESDSWLASFSFWESDFLPVSDFNFPFPWPPAVFAVFPKLHPCYVYGRYVLLLLLHISLLGSSSYSKEERMGIRRRRRMRRRLLNAFPFLVRSACIAFVVSRSSVRR